MAGSHQGQKRPVAVSLVLRIWDSWESERELLCAVRELPAEIGDDSGEAWTVGLAREKKRRRRHGRSEENMLKMYWEFRIEAIET